MGTADVQKVILNHSSGKDFVECDKYKNTELIMAWQHFPKKNAYD